MINWTKPQIEVLGAKGNLLVSASAGSGKTTVMIQKVLQLLKEGADISKMLLITFSRAAAAEMRDKFIEKLYDELSVSGDKHLYKQLEQLNFAAISTIDSFCYSLFKKHYAVLEMDPAFELFDENEAKLLFSQSVDEALDEYIEKGDEGIILLIERFSARRSVEPLKNLISRISDYLNVLPDVDDFVQNVLPLSNTTQFDHSPVVMYYLDERKKMFRRDINRLDEIAAECERYNMVKSLSVIAEITDFLNRVTACDYREMEALLSSDWKFTNAPKASKDDAAEAEIAKEFQKLKGDITARLRSLRDEFESSSTLMREVKESSVNVEKLIEITLHARAVYQEAKSAQKKLDFPDLSRLAVKLLSEDSVQQEVREQYEYVFVDEYQDVNYLQERLIELINAKNLFTVGDPKQSIYQFRYTEPKIFLTREGKYRSNKNIGSAKNLNDNFRSDKRVLDFINLVFNEVMTYEFGGADYKNEAQLIAGADYPIVSDMPAVEVALYDGSTEPDEDKEEENTSYQVYSVKESKKASETIDKCAAYIADKISRIVGIEKIYDPKTKTERVVEYRDIAILMKSRRGRALFKAFADAGIPYNARDFKEGTSYEIELLVNILRAANNSREDIPLTAVMLSPVYGFTPAELLEIRSIDRNLPFWAAVRAYKGDKNIELKINEVLSDLSAIREMNSFCGVNEIMQRIYRGKFGAFIASRGSQAKENVESFIESCDGECARYIGSFIEYYDEVYDGGDNFPSLGNAVTVSTIHKSKGLEYPIVFIAYADKGFTSTFISNEDVFIDSEFGVAAKHFDPVTKKKSDTILTKAFKMKKIFTEKQELLRVMYVALTRAKNHLFIVGKEVSHSNIYSEDQNNFVQWVSLAAQSNPKINDYIVSADAGVKKPGLTVEPQEISTEGAGNFVNASYDECHEDMSELDYAYPYWAAVSSPAKYTVTALQKMAVEETESDFSAKELFPEDESDRINKGVLYHRIMEKVELKEYTLDTLAQQVKALAESGKLPEECLGIDLAPALRALNSSLLVLARDRAEREKSFMLYMPLCELMENTPCGDKVLVQGVIDLLIMGEDNIIVDFKVSNSAVSDIRKRYKKQLEIYAAAAQAAFGISHFKKVIYLIGRDEIIEF